MQGCLPRARGLTQPERVEISGRRLIEAAAELIVEKGWEATTAAEIGRRAGYSRAMVHARYGSKDAILETLFATEYVKQLNPAPDPEATRPAPGARARRPHSAPLRRGPRPVARDVRTDVRGREDDIPGRSRTSGCGSTGAANAVETGLRKGIEDGSVRPDIDVDRAVNDISAAVFGIAYLWIMQAYPTRHGHARLTHVRARLMRDYGVSQLADCSEKRLRSSLHAAAKRCPTWLPVCQYNSPPHRSCRLWRRLAHRHPVVPGADDEPSLRGGSGSTASVIDHRGMAATVSEPSSPMVSSTDGPHRLQMLGDHRIEAEDRRVHRDPSTPSSGCETNAATGLPIDTPDTAIAVDCGSQPAHQRAHLRDHPHHPRDVGQRVHVRVGRPRPCAGAVARLHRQGDVEAQFVVGSAGPGTNSKSNGWPWPAPCTHTSHGVARRRCRHRCATAVAGPPSPSAASERGSRGSCSNFICS